jgi:hypothetical protein
MHFIYKWLKKCRFLTWVVEIHMQIRQRLDEVLDVL